MNTQLVENRIKVADAPTVPGLYFRSFQGETDYPIMAAIFNKSREADKADWLSTAEDVRADYSHLTNCDPALKFGAARWPNIAKFGKRRGKRSATIGACLSGRKNLSRPGNCTHPSILICGKLPGTGMRWLVGCVTSLTRRKMRNLAASVATQKRSLCDGRGAGGAWPKP